MPLVLLSEKLGERNVIRDFTEVAVEQEKSLMRNALS